LGPERASEASGLVGLYGAASDNAGADAAIEVRAFFNDGGGPLRDTR
jgi:hypothetical protein